MEPSVRPGLLWAGAAVAALAALSLAVGHATAWAREQSAIGVDEPIAIIYTTETTGNLEPCG